MIRVWTVEDGVRVDRAPTYQAIAVLGDPSHNFGDQDPIEVPDPDNYNRHVKIGSVPGTVERATFSIDARYALNLSDFLRLARRQCRIDVLGLVGACKNPQNFTEGWDKVVYFKDGDISTYGIENFGALGSDDQAASNENLELSAEEFYEYGKESFSRLAVDQDNREITAIDVCDNESCGDCGESSDGCQRVIAAMAGTGATPGTLPQVLYSSDNGVTFATNDISTLFSTEQIDDGECIGANYVGISNASNSIHFTNVDQLFLGTNSWTEVNTGFVAGGNPNHMDSLDASHTWIVGDGGYIYFTANPVLGVTVQESGVATTQNLQWVSAYSTKFVLAVGALNAVVYTDNGGDTWGSVTGPEPGVLLSTCHMWSPDVWIVTTTQGKVYYTINRGNTWTEKGLPVAATDIDAQEWVDEAEGYMAVQVGTGAARILRTITGGYEWVVLPDDLSGAQIAGADRLNDLAGCGTGSNQVFAGGLDDDGSSGIVTKAQA
jgi:photosystem II stability/assembly factor-like uncharacterized protein